MITQEGQSTSILWVDDDPFVINLGRRTLQLKGYEHFCGASTAAQALDILRGRMPEIDVIICDLNMPDKDGIEFLQELNSDPVHYSVILVSGEGDRALSAVAKLLTGGNLTILGGLKKPPSGLSLGHCLRRWKRARPSISRIDLAFCDDEFVHAFADDELILHYQPKISLTTGKISGFEALTRWRHPLHGLIYPGEFVAALVESNVGTQLTPWVLHTAFKQMQDWRVAGLSAGIAVNISMTDLAQPGFTKVVCATAEGSFVQPADVTLEVTETHAMASGSRALENLVRLHLRRFALSIDDFGTGHSSLAQLRDVPFSELKIDRGFVTGASTNGVIRPILEGSVDIAKRLAMTVVAEGVETEDDWKLVNSIRVDYAQGYYIARPMPGENVVTWAADWNRNR